jgi:hypothetical protein
VAGLAWVVVFGACETPVADVDSSADRDGTIAAQDAFVSTDAQGAFDATCLARCAECSIGYCDSISGWCDVDTVRSTFGCIAASSTCDELRDCIADPAP